MNKAESRAERRVIRQLTGLTFIGESRTKQSFAKEANINNIMKRYNKTGFYTDPAIAPTRKPMFGDFSGQVDFQSVQQRISTAYQEFEKLPSDIRAQFDNDPGLFLDTFNDPQHLELMRELGLKEKAELHQPPKGENTPNPPPEEPPAPPSEPEIGED